ncbi:MAG: bifunctional DNA-formamidopyrimidine glycosylase/DNA-(apurinic or apyrimidinic site) lyase [Desulfovibrio sp.]|nr:bifunctional DNA-formamidopyrimidine glycosylase/DNA-(apurinic or apyrimidinic site) lyase [Desulfovibrio sp.]
MPELPEVETVVRTLRPHVQYQTVTRAVLLRTSCLHGLSLPVERLTGFCITDVHRRGKLIVFELDGTHAQDTALRAVHAMRLVVHLRMTGRLMTWPADAAPHAYTRCVFDLVGPKGASRLFFDDVRAFGRVLLCPEGMLSQWKYWRSLGPEPLEMTAPDFAARLTGKHASLKAVLLDQKAVAGVGNIYADECLFAARLHPLRTASSLSAAECARLLLCLKDVLRRSIAQCGSSIRDYRDANGNVGAFQNSFAVYGRSGQPCRHCGHLLQRLRVAGRTTVCCPCCQQ